MSQRPGPRPAPAPPPAGSPLLTDGEPLVVAGLEFRVRVSGRRKRLGLTVERDRSLTLHAPPDCEADRAEAFVRESRGWIAEKLRLSEERQQLHPLRTLYNGEIHRYLGRDYRLLLVETSDSGEGGQGGAARTPPVRLVAGRIQLSGSVASDPQSARNALAEWYGRTGERWARGRLQPWAARLGVAEPTVQVRDLGHRWGTYRRDLSSEHRPGRIALHWATFQLPPHLIDYVIAHELAHIRIAGHGRDYWRLLSRALPECRSLKTELDDLGRRVWMGDVQQQAQ